MTDIQLKLLQIANAASDEADRCANNGLTAGTWIEKDFRGIADMLYELVEEMKKPPPVTAGVVESGSQK